MNRFCFSPFPLGESMLTVMATEDFPPSSRADDTVDSANQDSADSRAAEAAGLPALSPDFAETTLGMEFDNIVPSRGYQMTPVVGLGGSAGGIQALSEFFKAAPVDSGVVFVVVVHLSPEHESMLASVLSRATAMPVVQATDGVRMQADHVYVIPPGNYLSAVDGHLRLTHLEPERGKRVAVDVFFRTLADTHGPHAVAIVLSGADGDGAIGIKRVKERGGLTIAQDPDEAEHNSMPRAAIVTGMVDWVLKVADMPVRLLEYVRRERRLKLPPEEGSQPAEPVPQTPDEAEAALRDALVFLRTRTGHDFTYYKRATILRRVARRMQVNGVDDLPSYLGFLRTHPGETGALLQDLLISVTNFFRDREAFAALEAQIPQLFRDKGPHDAVRVWVAACATGEEAYSVAMLLAEHARTLDAPPRLQVFATDLDEEIVKRARDGVYPEAIATDVSEERLRRFFIKEPRGYRVRVDLRETVLFAQHDLLRDSPFSRLDLITCRNLLIYLNRPAQKRALEIFHFALRPEGRLFLGTSETVEDGSDLFVSLDKPHRLFARRQALRMGLPVPVGTGTLARSLQEQARQAERPVVPPHAVATPDLSPLWAGTGPEAAASKALSNEIHMRALEQLGPPSLLVDGQHDIVHLSGTAGQFLQFSVGELTRNLMRAVHPMLRLELRAAFYRATQSGEASESLNVPFELDGQPRAVDIRVSPAHDLAPGHFLVVFTAHAPLVGARPVALADDPIAQQLERELETLKAHLRDVVEQHESSTEEQKAGSEELQAMNEELRSASEELETSREELQSINEELMTVNQELKTKMEEVGQINSDLQNLINATAIATVFLDRNLCITRYTPTATALFNLIPSDLGRRLSDLRHRLEYPELEEDAERVLARLVPIEREVGRVDSGYFLARLLPYRTVDDQIAGIVLTFVDITERKRLDHERRQTVERLRLVVNSATDYAIFSTDLERRVTSWSPGAQSIFGYTEAEVAGQPADILYTPEDRAVDAVGQEVTTATQVGRFENERFHVRKDGSQFYGSGVVVPLREDAGKIIGFVKIMRDLTQANAMSEALRVSEERFRTLFDSMAEAFVVKEAVRDEARRVTDYRIVEANPAYCRQMGHPDPIGHTMLELMPRIEPVWLDKYTEVLDTGETTYFEARLGALDCWLSVAASRMEAADGARVAIFFSDVTERRQATEAAETHRQQLVEALQQNERVRAELEAAGEAKDHFLAVLSHELRTPLTPVFMALSNLARKTDLPESVKRAHAMIERNVQLEARFIDDLLDVTRISHGKMEVVREDMDLHQAAMRAVEISAPDLEQKRQPLTLALDAEAHHVSGDFARLQQAMWNLLKNASKFTPEGGTISLRSYNESDGVVVAVADTGIGMDAEVLARIFHPFEQADPSITRQFGGLGLGLAIAKATVDAHEGHIQVSSPGRGQGATFTIWLPLNPLALSNQ